MRTLFGSDELFANLKLMFNYCIYKFKSRPARIETDRIYFLTRLRLKNCVSGDQL